MAKHKTTSFLLRFSHRAKRYFAFALLLTCGGIIFSYALPLIVGFTVDKVIGGKEPNLPPFLLNRLPEMGRGDIASDLLTCALVVLACAVLSGCLTFLARLCLATGTERLTRSMRDTLFAHIQKLPFAWHTENRTGDIVQRCTQDVNMVQRFVSQQLIEIARILLMVGVAVVIMFQLNTVLALIATAYVPLVLTYSLLFYSNIASEFLACDEAEGELMVHIQENLTGVRVVRAFGRERYELKRFDEKNDIFISKWIKLGNTLGWFFSIGDVFSSSLLLVICAVGAALCVRGTVSLGTFLVFLSYAATLAWPVRMLGRILSEVSKTGVSVARLAEILDAEPEMEKEDAKKPPLDRDVVFENVSFGYGEQDVLKNVSFTIRRGTTLGILGATGSGKSTLTYLLNRLFDLPADGGRITIGGVDIREIDRYYLRRNVGLVLQEPFLFSRTIMENIDIAARSEDRERVQATAAVAAVDETIDAMPKQYDTLVGERGVTLSGGQKQRIAIARTLMLDAPIMIFDDSMSSLDAETDARIRQALRENAKNATLILISHRISTLMLCDKIIVLEEGRLVDSGTHSELISRPGLYRRVYDLQTDNGEGLE
ncbi:MAG TPA: ABC transporter ATP-binding protein [Papillibacter sp.]|jgi:ATP-binding cassette subfamily B protein|nr:ABC transporter ATP-binding protein [Papillibacter sp.]